MAESTRSCGPSARQVRGSGDRPRQGDEGRIPRAHARKSGGPARQECPGKERPGEDRPKDERPKDERLRARLKDERLKQYAAKLGFRFTVVSYQGIALAMPMSSKSYAPLGAGHQGSTPSATREGVKLSVNSRVTCVWR